MALSSETGDDPIVKLKKNKSVLGSRKYFWNKRSLRWLWYLKKKKIRTALFTEKKSYSIFTHIAERKKLN